MFHYCLYIPTFQAGLCPVGSVPHCCLSQQLCPQVQEQTYFCGIHQEKLLLPPLRPKCSFTSRDSRRAQHPQAKLPTGTRIHFPTQAALSDASDSQRAFSTQTLKKQFRASQKRHLTARVPAFTALLGNPGWAQRDGATRLGYSLQSRAGSPQACSAGLPH